MADIDPESQETGFEDLNFVTNIHRGDDLNHTRIFYELLPRFGFDVSLHDGARDTADNAMPNFERVLVKKDQTFKLSDLTKALDETPEGKLLWQVTDWNYESLDGLLFRGTSDAETGIIDIKWVTKNRSFIESCLKTALLRRAEVARRNNQIEEGGSYEMRASQLEEKPLTKEKIREIIESKLIDILRDRQDLRP